jgi:C-terminal processing protease CtpA/Prc
MLLVRHSIDYFFHKIICIYFDFFNKFNNKNMRQILALLLILFFGTVMVSESQVLFQPANLNFEKGLDSSQAMSWVFPRKLEESGYSAMLSKINPAEGELCLMISSPENTNEIEDAEKNAAPIYQIIDAIPYRGKKVRISAMARMESKNNLSLGQLWTIGRSTKENVTISKYLDENPVVTETWKNYEIIIDVPEETNELRFGILLQGIGKLWVDNFKIDVIQPKGSIDEPAKILTEKSLNNLTALAKLYGYLNYFNPANILSTSENELITLWAVANAEKAKDDKELISFLSKYTKMMSPLSVVNTKQDTTIAYDKPESSPDYLALTRQHTGGPVERQDDLYSSTVNNVFATNRKREASVIQLLEVLKYKGKKLKISASIKVEQQSPGANAQIWARADKIGQKDNVISTTALSPAMLNAWKKYELTIDLPQDVYTLKIALVFMGEGKASFDDVKIDVIEKDKKTDEVPLLNNGFELLDSKGFPRNWDYEATVLAAGYSLYSDSTNCTKGKYSISMESEKEGRISYPIIGKLYSYQIDNNIYLHHPLVYYADDKGTVPAQTTPDFKLDGKSKGYNPNVNDRLTRVASVIKLWNLIKHFTIKNLSNQNIDSVLRVGLQNASSNDITFEKTIESMLTITGDLRARTWNLNSEFDYSVPFIIRELNNKYYISTIVDSTLGLNIGDELVKIGDISAENYLDNRVAQIPGDNKKFKTIKALAEIRAGAKATTEKFTFQKPDGKIVELTSARNVLLQNIYEPKPIEVFEIDTGYVYIDITEMSDARFKEFIEPLSQRKAFIFDLRGMTSMSEHFLGLLTNDSLKNAKWEIPVYTQPDKNSMSSLVFGSGKIRPSGKLAGKKSIFLIDERTSGYAEAIAAIVKANKLGIVVGKPSAGNASEVYPVRLFGGYNVSLSGLNVYSPDNNWIFNNSVTPDVVFEYELPKNNYTYDNFITKALELLKK